ncbi:MAG: hypothetical protein A2007_06460 [Verrucomicrobia bacterium GWC2_42_7]|nr:MAG: hypothetical protein A2007_06460 [Verrucomicrobia bacterium GWC2_42_7]
MESFISQLLELQDHDAKYIRLVAFLEHIPLELDMIQTKLKQAQVKIEIERKSFLASELERKNIDAKLKEAEEKIVKLKTQQMQVKKNEEYEAINKEISTITEQINDLEFEGLDLLDKIDKQKIALSSNEENYKNEMKSIDAEIALLKKRKISMEEDKNQEWAQVQSLEQAIDPRLLSMYRAVKSRVKKPPFVVLLKDQLCTGCHLKVSNEIVKKVHDTKNPHQCDNCSRIVFKG